MWRIDSSEKTLMLGEIGGRRRRGRQRWDGWMASLTPWTWVWVNSGRWWWTGRPGMLWFMELQRVGHDWVTELNWTVVDTFFSHQKYYREIKQKAFCWQKLGDGWIKWLIKYKNKLHSFIRELLNKLIWSIICKHHARSWRTAWNQTMKIQCHWPLTSDPLGQLRERAKKQMALLFK